MRVNEEIDAMEVMGIPSIAFAVASRLAAVFVVMPIAYLVALGAAEGAAWIGSYVRSGSVSQGTWEFAFYTVTSLTDIVLSFIKGMVMTIAVVLVALYFGYRVGGGPVEVGTATARSMAVNLDPGHGPEHGHDLPVLGLQPAAADRVTAERTSPGPAARAARVAVALLLVAIAVVALVVARSDRAAPTSCARRSTTSAA